MSKKAKTVLAVVLFVVLIAAAALAWHFLGPQNDVAEGSKSITVTVVHGDSDSSVFTLRTDAEYLRGALDEQKLVAGDESEYGLFIKTVDGETADEANQEWWCIKKDGQMLNTSVDTTPIADGDSYEILLTVGYDT